ncbi:MAG: hypothetical protein KZQ76_07295, partial [Candidatus Thiodiazotropha sp. (ex Epidulcina cf. delphinae)]|nr:hypothetical protein [Candidatus Thiodiazotropha sp. (ex Epidulcina cf. delphinae)]
QVISDIDLVPTALHVPPGNISTGSHFTVTSTIANQGTSNPTGYFSVGYYLSTDAQITAADTKIADRRVYSLRAGAGLNLSATVYIPAGMAPGTYYLGVLVDKNDSQAEANEGNNGLAAAGARQVISDIDLVPTALHVPPGNISTGSHFTVTSSIANQGTSNPTGYFFVGYYLSTDAQITAADTKIADRRVYSLRAGAGLNLSATVYIPAGMAPGTYYLGVLVDKNDSQAEANEGNNGLAAAGARQVISDIDLVPTALHVPPGNISTGSHFTVTSSIANQGTSNPTGYFSVGYYLSTDAQITAADTKIADRRISSLRAGAGLNLSATVYIPARMAPGIYYLGVLVDENDSQAEADEGNNGLAAAGARQVISDIDLVPTALHVPPGNISTGSHFTVTSSIANQGTSNPTGYFSVGYYLSTDAQITAADTKIADRRISSLRAGAGLNLSATVYIPAGMAPGTYYLGVLVDENDSQAEADESNNALGTQVNVVQ